MNEDFFGDLIVVKRSGQRVSFNGSKIALAIKKAFDSERFTSNEKDINKVYESALKYIKDNYEGRKTINVEDVQDIIEKELLALKYNDVYESFKDYREKRRVSRELFSEKEEHKFAKATTKIINAYGNYSFYKPIDVLLNFGKTLSLEYTKAYLLESKFLRAHDEGKIYINNLEFYSLGIFSSCHLDLTNFLECSFIKNLTKEMSGEISIPNLDYLLEESFVDLFKKIYKNKLIGYLKLSGVLSYINKLKLEIEIDKQSTILFKDKLEDFILNDKVRNIFESAYEDSLEYLKEKFSRNIEKTLNDLDNTDLKLNKNIFSISFGGNESFEGKLINEVLISIIKKLDLKNVVFIYKLYKKKESENFKEICELISQGKNVSLLILKNKNDNYKQDKEYFYNGSLIYDNIFVDKRQSQGRMIIDSISINMGVLGIKNKGKNINEFYKDFEDILELSKNALISSFEYKANKFKDNFKYLFKENILTGSDKLEDDSKIRKILKQGVLNIELVGLKECAYLLKGKTKDAITLGIKIIEFARKKCDEYRNSEKLNFALSNISEEKVLKAFMSIDKSIYGIINDVTDKERYDNFESIFEELEVSVNEKYKYFETLKKLFNGGFMAVVVLNKRSSISQIKEIVEKIKEYDIEFVRFKVGRKDNSS